MNGSIADDEEDPLDSFMKDISKDAVKQETFTLYKHKDQYFFHPVGDSKNEAENNIEEEPTIDQSKIITMEDIFKGFFLNFFTILINRTLSPKIINIKSNLFYR